MGSYSSRRDSLDAMPEESAKERMQRRERGEVPARFGGTREHGVRNTMSTVAPSGTAPSGMGSLKRSGDPLDRMPMRGAGGEPAPPSDNHGASSRGDRDRSERMAAMDKKGPIQVSS